MTDGAHRRSFVLAIHGGAGVIERADMKPEAAQAYRTALRAALQTGYDVLAREGASLDAVVAAVRVLEDDPLFNAGRGAALTTEARAELDASVMEGATRRAGAVTLVKTVRHPVELARLVMEQTPHVMLAAEGAEALARRHGLAMAEPSDFVTERRLRALERWQAATLGAANMTESDRHGTVGAVALDAAGNLAAATSTGGRTGKLPGRVGDSPLIGAGTYADNASAAVSCTGEGEHFMRILAAHSVAMLMELKGFDVGRAAHAVVHERLAAIGGRGGLIALDCRGRVAMPFSTAGMYRGVIRADGVASMGMFPEDAVDEGRGAAEPP